MLCHHAAVEFDGHIMGGSFASGDRIVAGRWFRSPFGPFADIMWCRPDGRRVLLAPDERVRDFVARHYAFDDLRVAHVRVERAEAGVIEATAGPIRLVLRPGGTSLASTMLAVRPRRLRTAKRWIGIEDRVFRPILRPLFAAAGVRTTGRTLAGTREWYAIHDFRTAAATATIDGVTLGPPAPGAPAGFGFSEFPAEPALVRVTSFVELDVASGFEAPVPRGARASGR
ncbi:hypothetical protein BH18ACT17_BH18ACT17_02180 [soil metagenome]